MTYWHLDLGVCRDETLGTRNHITVFTEERVVVMRGNGWPAPHAWLLWALLVTLVQDDDGWRLPYADPGIDGPGVPCRFPLDPLILSGQPIGQYHCPYCGSMVLAGVPHLDYDMGRIDVEVDITPPPAPAWTDPEDPF